MSFNILFIECSTTGAGALCNQAARDYGAKVFLITNKQKYNYGRDITDFVDEIVECDTNSYEDLSICLDQLKKRIPIHAVTTTADLYVPQAAFAAEKLNLIGLSHEAARSVRNKYLMRESIQKFYPAFNPLFLSMTSFEEGLEFSRKAGYPLVAKPKNGDGGDKVVLISNENDLNDYFYNYLAWDKNNGGQNYENGVLLESYIPGVEYSVETLQNKGGDVQLMGVTTKTIAQERKCAFIEVGHYFPYEGPEVNKLFDAVKKVLIALKIDCGLIHTECKIDEDGSVKIVEINPRLAGGKIGSHLIKLATDFDPVRAIIDVAIGKTVHLELRPKGGAAICYLLPEKDGVFKEIENAELLKSKYSDLVEIYPLLKSDQKTRNTNSNYDCVACLITKGPNGKVAYQRAQEISQEVKVMIL